MAALHPGDPTDPASDLGPLSSEGAAERLMGQIKDAVDKGATLRTGGHRVDRPGAFVEPTVLTDVTPEMRAYLHAGQALITTCRLAADLSGL